MKEEKELTKNTKSAENPSKIDVNTKKAPKSLGAKSKEEDDLETIDNIEGNFVVLEIPVIAGQSGQSEQENDQETETTWELINLDHDDNYCIDQDEAGKLRIRLRLHVRGYMISKHLHENDLSVCFMLLRHGRERHILLAGIWTR